MDEEAYLKVAEFGDSYITYLYFKELLPFIFLVILAYIVFKNKRD